MNVDVLPLRRLPRSLDSFTYRLTTPLPSPLKGRWVRVPFRNHVIDAILWSVHERAAPKGLRDVTDFLPLPPLTTEQCILIDWMASSCGISLAHSAATLLPDRPKRSAPERVVRRSVERTPLVLDRSRVRLFDRALEHLPFTQKQKNIFIPCATLSERLFVSARLAAKWTTSQVCMVVPTVDVLRAYASLLQKRFFSRLVVLDPTRSPGEYWRQWQSVADKRTAIVLMTRRGLGAPFRNLGAVVVDAETNPLQKQFDQNPRYDVRDVAGRIAQSHSTPLFLLDRVCSLARWADVQTEKIPLPLPRQHRTVIDLSQERRGGNFDFITEPAMTAYRSLPNGRLLVFQNSRGEYRTLRCEVCGWTCPWVQAPRHCARCKSTALKGFGKGVQNLIRQFQKLFPKKHIVRYDADSGSDGVDEADIVVATAAVTYGIHTTFDMILVPAADQLFSLPEYWAPEHGYLLLERVSELLKTGGSFLVQGWDAHHPVLKAFHEQNPTPLYENELRMRKKLFFPPATRLVRLMGRSTNVATIEDLQRKYANSASVRITGPLRAKQRNTVTFLVRLLQKENASATLRAFLRELPDSWLIDTDA